MNNRDLFIDLVGGIDPRHLETHIKKNTDTRSTRIKRYITAAAIYAAACIAVLLLIPYIITHTFVGDPTPSIPGETPVAPPVTTDAVTEQTDADPEVSIDEYFADTKLYKVLKALEIDRTDVAFLQVDDHQIQGGDVYYLVESEIYKNTDDYPVLNEYSTIDSFRVSGKYIFYTVLSEADSYPPIKHLHCYNMDTAEENVICEDDIYHYDVYDGELLYLSVPQTDTVKVYTYDPEEDKSVFVCDIPTTSNWIGDISYNGSEMAFVTDERCAVGQANVLDMNTKNMRFLYPGYFRGKLAITAAEDGYYVAFQRTTLDENGNLIDVDAVYDNGNIIKTDVNGVWYTKVSENPVKISDTYYDELYCVNGKLAGVKGDTVEAIDTDPDEVTEFPHSRTRYNDEAHREIGSKVIEALDKLYNDTVEANDGEVPKYLDSDFIATLTVRNYGSVQRQTTAYDDKCQQVIKKALTDNIPEKCIMSHLPSWEAGNLYQDESSEIKYYVLDQSRIPEGVDREELTLYLEYRYHQDRRSSVDYSQYYDIDVKALESKYGDLGTVAVCVWGSWDYWNMSTGVQRPIEFYPDYLEISAMYYNFMVNN